jgi:hypothetical protein
MPPSSSLFKPVPPLALEDRIQKLQQELGPQIQKGNSPRDDSEERRLPSGLEDIDQLLNGGFPLGRLSEICGPASSGRTSLVLALLRETTRAGGHVAVVDCADAFDPPSAEAIGVVLESVLWVRAPNIRAGLRCSERLLETEGFPLVVMDFSAAFSGNRTASATARKNATTRSSAVPTTRRNAPGRDPIPTAAWLRLTRLAAKRSNALILLSDERLAGGSAAVALEMQPAIPRFSGTPSLLEELETCAVLVRSRPMLGGPAAGESASQSRGTKVRLKVASNAA